jgi:hypothetical protein
MGNDNLARVGFRTGLDRCINLNPGTIRVSDGMMATTVEAILGAVHLDGGDAALATVMGNLGLTHDLLVMSFPCPVFPSCRFSSRLGVLLSMLVQLKRNIDFIGSLPAGPHCPFHALAGGT